MKSATRSFTIGWLVLAAFGMSPDVSAQSGAPARKWKVVIFGGHPDDPESGAGGLAAMLTRQGHEVILAYGTAYRGDRRFFDRPEADVRREEAAAACKVLGATPKFFSYAHKKPVADEAPLPFLARTGGGQASGTGKPSSAGAGTRIENQSRWIEVEGSRVHYLIEGDEKGRPIVLLHGAKFQAETWKEIGTMKALAQAGYNVIAVDLPGHGKSGASQGDARTWLRGLLDALKVEKPVVVSPSMSGRFSLPLVTEEPQRVSGFVAVAPVGIPRSRDQLQRITAPVLAIWGENDRIVSLDQADLLVRSVKQGRKVIIPGAGHAVYMDAPAAFHEELLRFLKELPQGR